MNDPVLTKRLNNCLNTCVKYAKTGTIADIVLRKAVAQVRIKLRFIPTGDNDHDLFAAYDWYDFSGEDGLFGLKQIRQAFLAGGYAFSLDAGDEKLTAYLEQAINDDVDITDVNSYFQTINPAGSALDRKQEPRKL